YPLLLKVESTGDWQKYAKMVAKLFDYDPISVQDELKLRAKGQTTYQPAVKVQKRLPDAKQKEINDTLKVQNKLMSIWLLEPKSRDLIKDIESPMFLEEEARELFDFIKNHRDYVYNPTDGKALRSLEDYGKLL